MAQNITVAIITDDNYEVGAILSGVPSREDIEIVCNDNDMYGNIDCYYVCYNVGDGEGGIDTFFSQEELESILYDADNDEDDFEKAIESKGYSIESYHRGDIGFYLEE